jgi:hypothetical protein
MGDKTTAAKVPHMLRNFKTFGAAVLFLGVTGLRGSAAELAPIQVSLVIQESCMIQSLADYAANASPRVSCLHDTPYSVALAPRDPTRRLSTLQLSERTRPRVVWTVAF